MKRVLVYSIFIAVASLCALSLPRLQLDEDITKLLPVDDPMVSDYREVITQFQALDMLFIDVAATGNNQSETLYSAADELYQKLLNSGKFRTLYYRTQTSDLLALQEIISQSLPTLIDEHDYKVIESLLTNESINPRIASIKRQLMEPGGSFMMESLRRNPLGIQEIANEKFQGLSIAQSESQIVDGRIVSKDGNHVLMIAIPKFNSMDTAKGESLAVTLEQARESVRTNSDEVTVTFHGGHLIALDNSRAIKRDVRITIAVVSIAIGLLGFFVFRRLVFIPLVFIPPALGALFASGVFATFHPMISGIALGCGAALVGITVDYGIHLLYRLQNSASKTPYSVLRELLPSLFLAAGTTFLAFLTLTTSGLPGQRQLGLFSALGVLGAFMTAAVLLPFITPNLKGTTDRTVLPLELWYCKLSALRRSHATHFLIGGLAIAIVAGYGLSNLEFESDFRALNYMKQERLQAEAALESTWGRFDESMAIVKGTSIEEVLSKQEALSHTIGNLKQGGTIEAYSSISKVLPSRSAQEHNIRRWKAFWDTNRIERLRSTIEAAASENGFSKDAFEPFFKQLKEERVILELSTYQKTFLKGALQRSIRNDGDQWWAMTGFKVKAGQEFTEAASSISDANPDAIIINPDEFAEHTKRLSRKELLGLALSSGFVVVLFLFHFFRRLSMLFVVIAPIVLSVVITLGILGFFSIKINLVSSLFIVYVFGVGVDYSIFLATSIKSSGSGRSRAESSAAGAVMIAATTTTLGFAAMSLGSHPAVSSIGITGLVGVISALCCALVLVPTLTDKLVRPPKLPSSVTPENAHKHAHKLYQPSRQYAEQYAFWKARLDPICREIDSIVPRQGAVLDVGCGQGLIAVILGMSSKTRTITGFDLDEVKIAAASDVSPLLDNVSFVHSELSEFSGGDFQSVLLIDVLHYWKPDKQDAMIRRAASLVTPGGTLVLREAMESGGRAHFLVRVGELFTTAFGFNPAGDGLHFRKQRFYEDILKQEGLFPKSGSTIPGRGSNVTLIFEKPIYE